MHVEARVSQAMSRLRRSEGVADRSGCLRTATGLTKVKREILLPQVGERRLPSDRYYRPP